MTDARSRLALALALALATCTQARGAGLPNFDVRSGKAAAPLRRALTSSPAEVQLRTKLVADMAAAKEELQALVPELTVESHPALHTPVVVARGGFLSGPAPGTDPAAPVRGFVARNSPLFGLSGAEVDGLTTTASYTNPAGNLSWATLGQQVNGIPVFRGELRAAVTAKGEVAAMTSELAAGLDPSRFVTPPRLSAEDAVRSAAANVGVTLEPGTPSLLERSAEGARYRFARGPFVADTTVEQTIFPLGPAEGRLAWQVLVWQKGAAYLIVVDGADGTVLFRKNIAADQSQDMTFDVYPSDSPGPLSPTTATPGSGIQGPAASRSRFTLVSELPAFDNLGWIRDGTNLTTGNNVDAGLDVDGVDGIDSNGRIMGGCTGPSANCRNFFIAYNPPPGGTDAPGGASFRVGAVMDLFFWSNRYHDRLYRLGFTEAARNFQNDNFGRGGAGGDPVLAQAQDSSDTSNAVFVTPPDGRSGVMEMYVFTDPDPDRDGDLDHDIVLHELTHGLSGRLVGNGAGLDNTQGGGMGEGWSDFYSLSLLAEPGDDPNASYAHGAYAVLNIRTRRGALGTDNYFYGGRRFPYSTQTRINPLTFADIDPQQIDTGGGLYPESPLQFSQTGANEVHNVGQIWALMLWEGRANLIARLGGAAGNERMLQVVTDGLKLTPNSPTFVQARDAILQADCAGFAGADEIDLWRGFAKRGLGTSAVAPPSASESLSGVVEASDLPLFSQAPLVSDVAGGNGNGAIDPGETIDVTVPLRNGFRCAPVSLSATLSSSTPGVTVLQGSSTYGTIAASATVNGTAYRLRVDGAVPCGTSIELALALAGGLQGTTRQRVPTGSVGPPSTFAYTGAALAIPDNDPTGATAVVTVPGSSVVGDVNVSLTDVRHTYIGDLVVQLIAPDTTAVTLVDRIPDRAGSNSSDNLLNTVLDDGAATAIQPQRGSVSNARFSPANPLSGFNGKSASGTWQLKMVDASAQDVGTLNAWSLAIAPRVCSIVTATTTTTSTSTTSTQTTSTTRPAITTTTTTSTSTTTSTPVTTITTSTTGTTLPAVTLAIGNGVSAGVGAEFCVDLSLSNQTAVRAFEGSLVDVPDEFELMRAECTARSPRFSCSANQVAGTNRIRFVIVSLEGACIDAGQGPVARVCLRDREPACQLPAGVGLVPEGVTVADCGSRPLGVRTSSGTVVCQERGDCRGDGTLDILDVLEAIDIVLERKTPTEAQRALCDATCDGRLDILDILRGIDVILERVPRPLTCPAAPAGQAVANASLPRHTTPRVSVRGGAVVLDNPHAPVRGVEVTLVAVGTPPRVMRLRGTRRTRRFLVTHHQDGHGRVRLVVVSLKGEVLGKGRGPIATLMTAKGKGAVRWLVQDVTVVE